MIFSPDFYLIFSFTFFHILLFFSYVFVIGRPILPIRSVFTDVGYQSTLKLQDKSDPNDKFNVRTEIGKFEKNKKQTEAIPMKPIDPSKEARLNPGVIKRVPPTGKYYINLILYHIYFIEIFLHIENSYISKYYELYFR